MPIACLCTVKVNHHFVRVLFSSTIRYESPAQKANKRCLISPANRKMMAQTLRNKTRMQKANQLKRARARESKRMKGKSHTVERTLAGAHFHVTEECWLLEDVVRAGPFGWNDPPTLVRDPDTQTVVRKKEKRWEAGGNVFLSRERLRRANGYLFRQRRHGTREKEKDCETIFTLLCFLSFIFRYPLLRDSAWWFSSSS